MRRFLSLRNSQRTRPVNARHFRRAIRKLLIDLLGLGAFDLGVGLVTTPEMIRLNETFVRHRGATDVIAFDYREAAGDAPPPSSCSPSSLRRTPDRQISRPALRGEILICLDIAVLQARRFRTSWQSELMRYLIHGVLHLLGYDDLDPASRRRMKQEEDRLLRQLARRLPLRRLARTRPPCP